MSVDVLPVWDLMQTAHVVGRRFTRLMSELGLTPTQLAVLRNLDDQGGATQAEVARAVLVSPQSIGALLSPLLERGLVTRDGPGGRGRRAGLGLTDAGRDVLQQAWGPVRDFNSPSSLGLTPAQTAMLVETLELVRARMADEPNTSPPRPTPLPAEDGGGRPS